MAGVVPNVSEALFLSIQLGKVSPENLLLKLYSNDYVPVYSTVVGNLTEVIGSGYSAKTLTPADWTVTASVGPGGGIASAPQQTWTLSVAATAYGYYLVGASSGTLYWLERFSDGPYVLGVVGGIIRVVPTFRGRSGSED
jgi:hypothetical protein